MNSQQSGTLLCSNDKWTEKEKEITETTPFTVAPTNTQYQDTEKDIGSWKDLPCS